ncbi:hypothetical protein [Richelia sinica]|uniref:hypothetical protein n=1 Tax=Richelia sinica TaxID=1357545 RepID=UPI001683F617|nr:hypothetical protein [Richelia sinica]MBD2666691.1 hypothetical protein [Richelia sinica FACHB-800]
MLVKKGFVDKNKIWTWVKTWEDKLVNETWNGKENISGRKCLWFGVGVNLGVKSKVFEGMAIDDGLRKRCNQLWCGDDWNSILLYKYQAGCSLKNHIDREIFHNKVIVVNISQDSLFGGNIEFYYDGNIYKLSNGEVIEFNNKVIHGVRKVNHERWSLSIRKVLV